MLRPSRGTYFVLGLATTALCAGVLSAWDCIARLWLDQAHLAYDLQPRWFKTLHWSVGQLPWLVGLTLLPLKLRGKREIRLGAYLVGAFLPFAAFAIWIFGEAPVSNWWHRERFDPARWRAPPDSAEVFWPARLRMIDDLLSRNTLGNLTRDSVRALLGPPNAGTPDPASTVRYYLGPERDWIRIDGEELVIEFDESGWVVNARTVRD